MEKPRLFSTFMLWILAQLYEALPEIGDVPKPKLCFFFDEAHLLFDDASEALLDQIERTARLIRSKGVGIYFVTHVAHGRGLVPCSRSWATASSTRCARSRPTTPTRCARPCAPSR